MRRRIDDAHSVVRRAMALVALAVLATLAIRAHARPVSAVEPAKPRVASLRDSPGWRPLVDPDSASVRAGRMLNAPLVARPFAGGATSLDALGRRVCRALRIQKRDSLEALCVTEDEFREILWPEFPQSRRVTGQTWEDGWAVLGNRLKAGSQQAVQDFGGSWEFVRLDVDSVMRYRNFTMHGRITMVVRDPSGRLVTWGWLRAVVERRGRFKLYSLTD